MSKYTAVGDGGTSANSAAAAASASAAAAAAASAAAAAAARADVFDALHAEMEFADYARGQSGQKVKRVPRNQAPERTTKRRALEEADMTEMAIEVDDDDYLPDGENKRRRKRLRGSKVAFDVAVTKSMPGLTNVKQWPEDAKNGARGAGSKEDGDSGGALHKELDERYEMFHEVAALGIDLGLDEVDKLDDNDEDGGEEDASSDDDINSNSEHDESGDEQDMKKSKSTSQLNERANVSVSKDGLIKPKKRLMHRLRDFTSQRLAEKHGEAIGAHIMGMSETAVQKLRQVAKSAPGAPQVYSSLGMVFESMRTETEGRRDLREQGDICEADNNTQIILLQRRMELAQKTYASYHVASLLTKRDFVLWERSGDAAIKVVEVYSEIIAQMTNNPNSNPNVNAHVTLKDGMLTCTGFDPNHGKKKWRSQQKFWMEHALSAYQSSDKLRPPGVDVPCKLAQVHMNLGNYIDALTILTDLRNKANGDSSGGGDEPDIAARRSEMEGSYPCWLLYSDLMMKIGYECKQWNNGASTSQSYMFKRWLRKNSKDFDWGERRLQALCLALEAAAGSASCVKLIRWMRKRADKYLLQNIDLDVENGNESNAGDIHVEKKKKNNVTDKDAPFATISTYEEERETLLHRNKMELQIFDRKTKEMKLVAGSHIYKNRIASRAALLEKHRTTMKKLAEMKYAEEQQSSPAVNERSDEFDFPPKSLPIQGSFATVYDIAALLVRQCIELKLFDGGLLAVQSVLDYSKERVSSLRQKRIEEANEKPHNTVHGLVQSGFKYDKINFESDDSEDDDHRIYLSDDETLEQSGALQSLKSVSLPLDIRAMHAVCLLGVGGQDYVALNFVDQVIMSKEMDLFCNDDLNHDGSLGSDPRWMAFSKYYNAPVNKSFVLACVAHLVSGDVEAEDHSRSKRVLGIFRKHLREMDNNQGKNKGIVEALTSSKEPDRAHTLKVLLTTLKLMIRCTRKNLATLNEPGIEEAKVVERAVIDSMYILQTMLRFHHEFWKPRYSDWSLPDFSIDMVSILSGALSILVQAASFSEDKRETDFVRIGSTKARHLISIICHGDSAPSKQSKDKNFELLRSFPLPCLWQTSLHVKISLRTYNLCVACCVSAFSGWEPSEFNLDNLRHNDVNFFGVTLEGQWVAGFLANSVASSVAKQWERMSAILPELEILPFERHLEERKRTSWYQKVMGNIEKQSIDSKKIQSYGEDDGIKALLSFSSLCLLAAEGSEGDEKDELLGFSLSVLLPITQFCIDKQVWHSSIGSLCIGPRNNTKVDYYVDENCNWLGPTKTQQGQVQNTNKTQRSQRPSKVERPTRLLPQPSKVMTVPTSVLLKLWTTDGMHRDRGNAIKGAQLSMNKVDDAMRNLRKSRTLNSLERASIDVAVALIGLTAYDECENPLVCLQQAAMFAGLGSKRGNNDEAFKRFLPLKNKCTPLEALNILGRADCLRAIHFLHEAQYLCNWIASVCHSHRDHLQEDFFWNSRWRVVGIMTYIVSSIIEETSEALYQDNMGAEAALREWENISKEEIRCGKSDALALVSANPSVSTQINSLHEEEKMLPDYEGYQDVNGIIYHQDASHNGFDSSNAEQTYFEEGKLDDEELVLEENDDYDPYEGNSSNAEQTYFEEGKLDDEELVLEENDDYDPYEEIEVVGV